MEETEGIKETEEAGEGNFPKAILNDPLSKETRGERRYLLGFSALGIVMVWTGLIPEKISALGIEFSKTDQSTILRVLAVVIIYFLAAFIFYAMSDYWSYKINRYLDVERFDLRLISLLKELIINANKRIEILKESGSELRALNSEFGQLHKEAELLGKEMKEHTDLLEPALVSERAGVEKDRSEEFSKREAELISRRKELILASEVANRSDEKLKPIEEEAEIKNMVVKSRKYLKSRAVFVAYVRLVFDFLVPPIVAVYTIILLFWFASKS